MVQYLNGTELPCLCPCHNTKSQTQPPKVIDILDAAFQHGHPAFNDLMIAQMKLHSEKNHGYASGGDALGNFKRVARILELYPGFPSATPIDVAVMYCLKHIDRILWDRSRGIEPSDESLADIAVYMTIIRCMGIDRVAEYAK